MEGSVVDLGQWASRSQQVNHDPQPEPNYPVSDWLGVRHIDLTCHYCT